jgi:hypothetical protein
MIVPPLACQFVNVVNVVSLCLGLFIVVDGCLALCFINVFIVITNVVAFIWPKFCRSYDANSSLLLFQR